MQNLGQAILLVVTVAPQFWLSLGGTTYKWYSDSLGFNVLGTGSPFTTPSNITQTDTFWVANYANGCESKRQAVVVSVLQIPSKATMPSGTSTLCVNSPNTVYTTSATNATTYQWSILLQAQA